MSDALKIKVGEAVCDYVTPGMRLGIGTGSTAEAFVYALAARVNDGLDIIGIPTSERTASLCQELGIKLTTLEETPELDLTIDGADEIDENFDLTKGGGGALLREKIVAAASKSMYVIADESKMVRHLGAFALPIEVNKFGLKATRIAIDHVADELGLNVQIELRQADGGAYQTDGGHLILDASFGHIRDASALNLALLQVPGVVQHGLFIDMAQKVFIANESGVKIIENGNL